jgi:hypothetical protein
MQKPGPDDALEVGPPMKAEKKVAQERGGQGRALLASTREHSSNLQRLTSSLSNVLRSIAKGACEPVQHRRVKQEVAVGSRSGARKTNDHV